MGFFKAPVPTRKQREISRQVIKKNSDCSHQKVYCEIEMAGHFFENGGLVPNSSEFRLKIFVSEPMSDPSPMCLRGATPTKSLSGACEVFLTRTIKHATCLIHFLVPWFNSQGLRAQVVRTSTHASHSCVAWNSNYVTNNTKMNETYVKCTKLQPSISPEVLILKLLYALSETFF